VLLVGCVAADAPTRMEHVEPAASAQPYTMLETTETTTDGPCPVIECNCRATDQQGDLLCPSKPDNNSIGACQDKLSDFTGSNGQSCSGWGLRGDNSQYKSVSGKLEGCGLMAGPADGPSCAEQNAKADHAFSCAVQKCDQQDLTEPQWNKLVAADRNQRCAMLGTMKHSCVEDALAKEPGFRVERTYDMGQDPPKVVTDGSGAETIGYGAANTAAKQQGLEGPLRRPDAIFDSGGNMTIYDAKFPCPRTAEFKNLSSKSYPSRRHKTGDAMMSNDQRGEYQEIADQGQPGAGQVKAVSPWDARKEKCD